MMEKDAKLLSKLSLMISENEFHALLHAQGKTRRITIITTTITRSCSIWENGKSAMRRTTGLP